MEKVPRPEAEEQGLGEVSESSSSSNSVQTQTCSVSTEVRAALAVSAGGEKQAGKPPVSPSCAALSFTPSSAAEPCESGFLFFSQI